MILLHNFIFLNNKAGRYVRFRADQNSCHLKQNKQNKQNNQNSQNNQNGFMLHANSC